MCKKTFIFLLFCFLINLTSVKAEELPLDIKQTSLVNEQLPILFEAENTYFDKQNNILKAWGNVEIFHNGMILKAERITYDLTNNKIQVDENAQLYTASGEIITTNYVQIKNQFEDILVDGLRLYLQDNSQISAMGGIYKKNQYWILNQASFSPCQFCDNKNKPLTWQLKAGQIYYDKKTEDIYYYDVVGEILGIPVFYSPYFSHPSPFVKRRSGFLAPSFSNSDQLGFVTKVPYYIVIDDTQDLTVTPWITTKHYGLLEVEFRKELEKGRFQINTSGTYTDLVEGKIKRKKKKFRGHLDAEAEYFFSPHTRLGLDLALQTDDTYRRVFDFDNQGTTENRLFIEDMRDKNYFIAQVLDYEDLRLDKYKFKDEPLILPYIYGELVTDPDPLGGIWHLYAEARSVRNKNYFADDLDFDQHHAILKADWVKNYVFDCGLVSNIDLTAQADIYHFNNALDDHFTEPFFFGQAHIDLRYPFVKADLHEDTFIIEPVLGVVLAPTTTRRAEIIPNIDSQTFELDDLNIFTGYRFTGWDRHDIGSRFYYGLHSEWMSQEHNLTVEAFIGQSLQFDLEDLLLDNKNDIFVDSSEFSDIVGRFYVSTDPIDIFYRFLIDNHDLSFNRHDIAARLNIHDRFKLTTTYSYVDESMSASDYVSFVTLDATVHLSEYWFAKAGLMHNFTDDFFPKAYGEIGYSDECFGISVLVEHEEANDRDIDDDLSVQLKFNFKYLGEDSLKVK